jgi:hypothetical protein
MVNGEGCLDSDKIISLYLGLEEHIIQVIRNRHSPFKREPIGFERAHHSPLYNKNINLNG